LRFVLVRWSLCRWLASLDSWSAVVIRLYSTTRATNGFRLRSSWLSCFVGINLTMILDLAKGTNFDEPNTQAGGNGMYHLRSPPEGESKAADLPQESAGEVEETTRCGFASLDYLA